MSKQNLERPIQIIFRVNERERDFINKKMEVAKIKNQSAYIRKMACDGYILNVDFSEFRELFANIGRISGSINQIAKRINSTNNIYAEDVAELKERQEKIWRSQINAIKTTLVKAIDYICDPTKTDTEFLVSGFNCTPEMAAYEFNFTKRAADKQGGRLAYHLIQSFAPGETTPEQAHEIGKQLADELLQGKYEYVISTHTNCSHLHNHIIFNSVSFKDLKKFHGAADIFHRIQRISDKLCQEHSLSVIEQTENRGKCYKEHLENKKGTSWKSALRETLDRCIKKAKDWDEFLSLMQAEDYEIKHGKHISFRAKEQTRFTRGKTLGERYTEENIKKQLHGEINISHAAEIKTEQPKISLLIDIENSIKAKQSAGYSHWANGFNLKTAAMTLCYLSDHKLLHYDNLVAKRDEVKGRRNASLKRIKEVESRIKILDKQIKDLDTFRKNKPIVEKLDSVVFKDKYKRENESAFILFNAAKQSLNAHFPNKKYPLIKTLRAEMNELYAEKNKLYPEYYEAKNELKTLEVMTSNVDSLLGRDAHEKQRDLRERHKNKDSLE